jgi:hypothetical protein
MRASNAVICPGVKEAEGGSGGGPPPLPLFFLEDVTAFLLRDGVGMGTLRSKYIPVQTDKSQAKVEEEEERYRVVSRLFA